jgi:hypothetical protein
MKDVHPVHRPETPSLPQPYYLSFSRRVIIGMFTAAILGGISAAGAASLYTNGSKRIALAYLAALAFVLSISLGSLFFTLIQHLTRAGWAVLIRRPAEVFAMNTITVGILSLPIIWSAYSGSQSIYPWATGVSVPELVSHVEGQHDSHDPKAHVYVHQQFDALTASKTPWLNPSFFTLRIGCYFLIWVAIASFYFHHSRNLDEQGGIASTLSMERWAGPSILLFALSLTFASFDLLMSLDPHWYSTIFGVYYFAGCAVGGFSVSLLSWLVLSQLAIMPVQISSSHLRDLGRLLFAFIFFWGYIAFSQYMLLWYANIPETTRWWAVRGASTADGLQSSWGIVLVILALGHFVIPFLGLMSRHVKDHRKAMMFWTIWILVMHYLDLYWLVMPEFRNSIAFGLPELGSLLLVCGIYAIGASFFATRTSMVPIGDPRIPASAALSDAY